MVSLESGSADFTRISWRPKLTSCTSAFAASNVRLKAGSLRSWMVTLVISLFTFPNLSVAVKVALKLPTAATFSNTPIYVFVSLVSWVVALKVPQRATVSGRQARVTDAELIATASSMLAAKLRVRR